MAEIQLADLIASMKPALRGVMDEWGKDQPALQVRARQDAPVETARPSPDPKPDPKPETKARMGAFGAGVGTMIEGADVRLPFLNVTIPVASAVVGAGAGLLVNHAVDLAVSPMTKDGKTNWINPVVKIAAAGAALKYGSGLMGPTAAKFAAGSLVFSVALAHTPVNDWLNQGLAKLDAWISKPITTTRARQSVLEQAQGVAASHGNRLDRLAYE